MTNGQTLAFPMPSQRQELGPPLRPHRRRRPGMAPHPRHEARQEQREQAFTADAVLEAVASLTDGQGVEQRALTEHLGVAAAVLGRLTRTLIEDGKLVQVSTRPKRFALGDVDGLQTVEE
jgi:hypothetical protein